MTFLVVGVVRGIAEEAEEGQGDNDDDGLPGACHIVKEALLAVASFGYYFSTIASICLHSCSRSWSAP